MRKPLSTGVFLEILNFVFQRENVRVPEIQKKFGLSYNSTQRIVEALEKHGILSPKNPNGRKVTIPFKGKQLIEEKHLLLDSDNNWSKQLLKDINLN